MGADSHSKQRTWLRRLAVTAVIFIAGVVFAGLFNVGLDYTNLNLADRAYFKTLMAGNRVKGFPIYGRSSGKKSALMAVPIVLDNKVIGALGASVFLDELHARLNQDLALPRSYIWYVLDSRGNTMLHTDGDFIFMNALTQGGQSLREALSEALKHESGAMQYVLGDVRHAHYRKLPRHGLVDGFGQNRGGSIASPSAPDDLARSLCPGFAKQETELQPLLAAEKRAGIANTQSQITERAARLGLDRVKLQSEVEMKLTELGAKQGELGEGAKKLVNDSVIASTAGEASAANMIDLADRFEREGGGYGGLSGALEFGKKAVGWQGRMTELRNNYARIRNSAAMRNLPPGPASDKDIEMARQGMPPETADAGHIASFLRGMAKIERMNAQLEEVE